MVSGHSSFGGQIAEHSFLLQIVTAHNGCLQITYCYR
jgi:hypothetical protein